MSNLSKLLKFENFNTEHLSVAVDMNSGGEMSKFVIPLFDNFAKRNFNISLFLPVFKGDVFYLSSALSFFWKLRNVKDELYLLRNGMIETKFTYSDGFFLAKETGEMLIPTKNNLDDEIKITDDNNLTYYFQMPSLSSKGTYNLKRIEYPDGFRLLFDDKVNFVLKTENMNEKTSPIWIVEFDLKRTDDIQEFKIYTKLGEEERIYCKGSITKKEYTATYYTIDIININGNGKEEYYFYEEGRIKEVITKEYRLIYRYVGEEVKGVTYKNENKEISYFYEKNILGEIIGIVDEEGKRVVEYRSSSYGEVENIHDNSKIEISAKDHLRYKGYIYDEETRLYYLKTRYYDPEIGRFISPDSIDYQSPESINGLNLYAYCGNDPINMVDPTGHFWDTVLDILFIGWDIYNLITNEGYKDWKNWAALLVDLAFAAIPFVTGGGGQVVKLANVADDISDFSKVTVIGESMSRVQTISQFVNATDNLYDGFKSYKKLSSLGKGGKVLAEIGGKSSNIAWLYGKLRSGYKVIDIGIDTVRTTRSSSYIVERITIAIWKSRNIWKWIYHLDF